MVTVENRIGVRYKKLDGDMGIAGIHTQQFSVWSRQQTLEGLEPLTNLVAGYQVDEFGKLDRTLLVCKLGGRTLWTIPEPHAGAPAVSQLPTTDDAPPATTVRPAAGADEDEGAAEGS